jgi:hypothetical protein
MLALNRSLLNKNYILINFRKALTSIISIYNPYLQYYTEVYYLIHEGKILSVQCEMNLRWSKLMREVNAPRANLIF